MRPEPRASEVPGHLLAMQIHEPHSRPAKSEFPVIEPMHLHPSQAPQVLSCRKKFGRHDTHLNGALLWCHTRALLCLGPTKIQTGDSDFTGLGRGLRTKTISEISPGDVQWNGLQPFITDCRRGRRAIRPCGVKYFCYYNRLKMKIL